MDRGTLEKTRLTYARVVVDCTVRPLDGVWVQRVSVLAAVGVWLHAVLVWSLEQPGFMQIVQRKYLKWRRVAEAPEIFIDGVGEPAVSVPSRVLRTDGGAGGDASGLGSTPARDKIH